MRGIFTLKYNVKFIIILLSIAQALPASECSYVFRFAGIFEGRGNPQLAFKMQDLQTSMNEVENFISRLSLSSSHRNFESFKEAFLHVNLLVQLSRELVEKSHHELAPARVMEKPLDEREKYLSVYQGMYMAQLRIFLVVLENFEENKSRPTEQWNFTKAKESLLQMQTLMTRAHIKY